MQGDPHNASAAGARTCRPGVARAVRWTLRRLALRGEPLLNGWRAALAALLVGVGPFVLGLLTGLRGQQLASAVLLGMLVLPLVLRDRWAAGLGVMGITFLAHCATVVTAAYWAPQATAAVLPGCEEYWAKQITWITTGEDPEYRLLYWLPAHVQMFTVSTLFTWTTLGVLTYFKGFFQVDLMNYYNGRLLEAARGDWRSLLLGWHPWSLARGAGYLFLTFELTSYSLELVIQTTLSTFRRRVLRWAIGLGLLVADGILKFVLLEPVRQGLEAFLDAGI